MLRTTYTIYKNTGNRDFVFLSFIAFFICFLVTEDFFKVIIQKLWKIWLNKPRKNGFNGKFWYFQRGLENSKLNFSSYYEQIDLVQQWQNSTRLCHQIELISHIVYRKTRYTELYATSEMSSSRYRFGLPPKCLSLFSRERCHPKDTSVRHRPFTHPI